MIRLIRKEDNEKVAAIIRAVMPEFGASGAGFAIHDDEVDNMYESYMHRAAYYVYELDGNVIGGGGVAQLKGGPEDICELKKMYFLPAARGKGLGQLVLDKCLGAARDLGYKYCYLETFNTMKLAMKLYERNNFGKIPGSLGNTGHFSCDTFYKLKL
jgi:putative acetyltransferase